MTSAPTPQRTTRPLDLTAPTLVACDIDGTLINTGQPPTAAVRAAVERVRAAGHHIALATGRSVVGALDAAVQLGLDDAWIVASNGAVTAHLAGGEYEITDLHTIDPEPVVRVAVEAMPGIRVAAEVVGVGYRVNVPFPDGDLPGEQRSVDVLEELWADPTPRLVIYGPAAFGLVPILRAMSLTAIATRPDWVDVTPPALSKATALDKCVANSASITRPRPRSATARTTWRCCGGRLGPSLWATRPSASATRRTPSPAPSTTTAPRTPCCRCSVSAGTRLARGDVALMTGEQHLSARAERTVRLPNSSRT